MNSNGARPKLSVREKDLSDKELRRALTRRAHKAWRRLRKSHRRVLRSCSANAIHDLRVATRRLQTLGDLAVFSTPSKRGARLRKRLKRLRHTLGRRRDVDVILSKLRERAGNTASARRRRILRAVIRRIGSEAQQVTKEMYRGTRKTRVKKIKRLTYEAVRGGRVMNQSSEVLDGAIRQAEEKWLAAIHTAKGRRSPASYHDVRIKTKTLRYMIELVSRFVDVAGAEATTEWLKAIQDELGEWHDDIELSRRVTAVLSQDAEYQANDAATALIKSLRDRAEASTGFASKLLMSLPNTWTTHKGAASSLSGSAR